MKPYRALILATLLILPACAQNLQNQIDEQGKAIINLQRKDQETEKALRRMRDDYEGEIERLRFDIEALRRTSLPPAQTEPPFGGTEMPETGVPGQQTGPLDGMPPSQPVQPPPPPEPTDKDLYNKAYGVFTDGNYAGARKMFNDLIAAHPGSPLVSSALYWVANSYFKEGKYEESISACDDVIKKFPQGNKTAEAYYLQALAFCEIKDPTTAEIILEDLIQKFPNSEAARLGRQKYEELQKKN